MTTKTLSHRFLTLCLTLMFVSTTAQLVLSRALPEDPMGHLTVVGMVKVNDKPAATGDIVASGSSVETAKGSSAVVSLGKLGRVEALPETRMRLRYSDSGITVLLAAGSVRVKTGADVTATITRQDQ